MLSLLTLITIYPLDLIGPPMTREWTAILGDRAEIAEVRSDNLFFTAQTSVGCLRMDSGKPVWKKKTEGWVQDSAISNKEIFALHGTMTQSTLSAYDLASGAERKVASFPASTSQLGYDDGKLFVLLPTRTIVALSAVDGKPLWRKELGNGKKAGGVMLAGVTASAGCVHTAVEGSIVCLDAATGKTLWKEQARSGGYNPPAIIGDRFLTLYDGLRLKEPKSGKDVWAKPGLMIENIGIVGDVMITEEESALVGRSLKDGRTLWTDKSGDEGFSFGSGGPPLMPSDDRGALLTTGNDLRYLSADGNDIWSTPIFFHGRPVYANAQRLITSDGERLYCYVRGARPGIPADEAGRKALAEQMAANYEELDKVEVQTLVSLGQYAAQPLIRKYTEWAKVGGDERRHSEGMGMLHYSLLQDTLPILDKITSPADTELLMQAIESVGSKNSYRDELVALLGKHGDPERTMPLYIEMLRKNPPKPGVWDRSGATLESVSKSKHPQAIAFMIESLRDPKAPESWRTAAYQNLAATAGEAAVEALRAARPKRQPRPRWEEQIDLTKMPSRSVVAEGKDSKGRKWRLFHSGVMGNHSDLYLAEKTPKGWGQPVFLGVYTQRTWHKPEPKSYKGIPMAKLLKTEWLKVFPADASLRKDSDADGLTDVAEVRLGTNAKKADTDGDGLKDSVDPCPNAAPRQLTDREKIAAAALDARFFSENWGAPAVIEIDGVKPFEMYGYSRPLLWQTSSYKGELPAMYNTGMNSISFHSTLRDDTRGRDWLEMGADGRTAKTLIRRYSGGLNGDGIEVRLVKFGEDWFVTDLVQRYVS